MIHITIQETENGLFTDPEDMLNIVDAMAIEFRKTKFLSGLHTGYSASISMNTIKFEFKGMAMKEKSGNSYLVRNIAAIISEMGLSDVCYVSDCINQPIAGDLIISTEIFKPEETRNSRLLKGLIEDNAVPETYLCNISKQTMDEPVYTTERPDIHYEKNQLMYWLYTQDNPVDIYTTKMIRPGNDIITDVTLKAEISSFVKEKINCGLREKQKMANGKLVETIKKYVSGNVTQETIDQAFRTAAAVDNVEDLKMIFRKVTSVDAQDNKQRKRTALHWAIEKNSVASIEWLLSVQAKTNIPDAFGKTAVDYAHLSSNAEIKKLLLGEMLEHKHSVNCGI